MKNAFDPVPPSSKLFATMNIMNDMNKDDTAIIRPLEKTDKRDTVNSGK